MDVAVGSRAAGKRELVTLDLLGAKGSSKDVDAAALKIAPFADLCRLDLNLAPADRRGDAAGQATRGCQSVCTIEKVKWALERVAERETRDGGEAERRRRDDGGGGSPSSSSSSSITTASVKRRHEGGEEGWTDDGGDSTGAGGSLVATGCPSCLSYVLISKGDPRCPRCDSRVAPPPPPPPPPPPQHKKSRISLNFSL